MTPWTVIHQVPLSGILQVKILEWVAISYFSGGSDSEASAYNPGDPGLIPGLGRSSGEGNGNPLQYSSLEKHMDGGAW